MTAEPGAARILAPHPDVEAAWLLDRVVLFDERDGAVHELSPTASQVWLRIDGHRSVAEVIDDLASAYAGLVPAQVMDLAAELIGLGVLTAAEPRRDLAGG